MRPALGLVVCLAAAPAAANPADTFGFGSRSTALGGAVSAEVSDASANYYNPAGLAWAQATELVTGVVHFAPQLRKGDTPSAVAGVTAWQLGLVVPGRFLNVPVAFGLAAQLSGKRIARVVTFTEDDQRWFLYEHRPEQLFLVSNIALRPLRNLSVGAGFGFLASTDGLLRVTGELEQPVAGASEFDSRLQHEVLAELSNVRYPNFGVRWQASDMFDFALVYRGEGTVTLDVDSEITGDIQFGSLSLPTRYLLYSKTVQSWIPQQLTLGVHLTPHPVLGLSLDLSWIDWSGLPSPVSATSSELSVDAQGALFPLPPLPPATQLESAHARDRLSPRIGVEVRQEHGPLPWRARTGYAFAPTGLEAGSSPNLLDCDAHVVSVGGGVEALRLSARGTLELDAHGQWGQLVGRPQQGPTGSEGSRAGSSLTGHWVAVGLQAVLRL
jgi:long-chain fatty acid transport protein